MKVYNYILCSYRHALPSLEIWVTLFQARQPTVFFFRSWQLAITCIYFICIVQKISATNRARIYDAVAYYPENDFF